MIGFVTEKIKKIKYLIKEGDYFYNNLWESDFCGIKRIVGIYVSLVSVLVNKLLSKCIGEWRMLIMVNKLLYYVNFLSNIKAVLFGIKIDLSSKKGVNKINFLGILIFFFNILFWFIFEFVFTVLYTLCFVDKFLCLLVSFYKIFVLCPQCDLDTPVIRESYFDKYFKEVNLKRIKR